MLGAWYTREVAETYKALETGSGGLGAKEAARRLEKNGPNTLPEAKPESVFSIFLKQFKSPLIYILLGASVIVFALGEPIDGAIILAVLIFNAVVGTIQEGRAQNTLRALKSFVETNAEVVREGSELIVPSEQVVEGDMIVLQEGEKVPADARVIISHSLKIDEAALTGESVPVSKVTDVLPHPNLPASEQGNMVFKGTYVVAGNGKAVVVATGAATVVGKIASEITQTVSEMPLVANIRYLSRLIIAAVLAVSVFLFVFGLSAGYTIERMFSTAVALAVSVIPEGLPIVLTLVLATGVWRMGKRNALVKRLPAVEALGQARVIAVDKTGTLTKNEIVVEKAYICGAFYAVTGVGYEPKGQVLRLPVRGTQTGDGRVVHAAEDPDLAAAARVAALTSNARAMYAEELSRWRVAGDPTEASLSVFAQKLGSTKDEIEKESPLLAELPFDSAVKYHALLHEAPGGNLLSVAGAPEILLELCHTVCRDGEHVPLSAKERTELESLFLSMSEEGLRVVALAEKRTKKTTLAHDDVGSLSLIGFLGLKDGLRPEVPDAMRKAAAAGIRVVMITGDHRVTAQAIARDAGILRPDSKVMTGNEINKLSDRQLADEIKHVSVFARMTPEHKLRIIQAYRRAGETVAMTGDGVNDAPSLVAADLGVAMGGIGTEVAKEASDIILLDDNFGSIVSAVEEGRSIYRTIKKVVLYLFSTNLSEVFVLIGALLLTLPLPLLPSQIIWLNFVTDPFLDASLAMDPKEKGLLRGTFERPNKYLVDRVMVRRMILMGITMAIGTLILFSLYVDDLAKALTVSLTTLAVFQWFNAWNCRSRLESIFTKNIFSNKFLIGATALVIFLQVLAVYTPLLQTILHTVPLTLSEWLMILVVASSIIVVEEIRKFFARRRAAIMAV